MCGVVGAAVAFQVAVVQHESETSKRQGCPFVLNRYKDFTLVRLSVGQLRSEVMPRARRYQHDGARWRRVSCEDMSHRRSGDIRSGALKLLAQVNKLQYLEPPASLEQS